MPRPAPDPPRLAEPASNRGLRVPLRLRVILLVTAFNVVVFGIGMAWLTERLSQMRGETAIVNEELLFERVPQLLGRGRGSTGQILDWPRWDRWEDAMILQLKELEPKWGLVPDLARAAHEERRIEVPRGVAVPLRPMPRRGPSVYVVPFVAWRGPLLAPPLPPFPLDVPAFRAAVSTTLTVPRVPTPTEVWGACFLPRRFLWPWQVPRAVTFVGLLPSRQHAQDARIRRLGLSVARALREARRLGSAQEIEGGTILPLTNLDGQVWGAAHFPRRRWEPRGPWPRRWLEGAFWPWNLFDHATLYVRPDFGYVPEREPGLFLNPMGSGHRPADWDQGAVLADIRRAAREERRIESERGLALPLRLGSGELWGGLWLKPRTEPVAPGVARELAPWFVLTTVLLTAATFIGMRSLVLEPVRRLARGASRLSSGDLSARIPEVHRRDELADLVRSFNAMAAEVEGFNARLTHEVRLATEAAREAEAAAMTQRRLAATGELAAGIAHEINNPLGGLLNAIEVLRREDLPPARRAQYLELVQSGLERIRETVGQVLRLAPRETRVELVSLADPVGDALGLVRHRAAQQRTALVLEGAGGPRGVDVAGALEPWRSLPPVRGQQNELGQAVLNLLVNGLDALGEGGTVRTGLAAKGSEVHLWVADDGPGMDPALLPRAADLFFSTKEAGRGTGLGLAIVHNVVGGHGGRVKLANPAGGGFRVDVWLPVAGEGEAAP